jgi:hypothetical protein
MILNQIWTSKIQFVFLLLTVYCHSTIGQDVIGLDPLMKEKRVKTKTQYECNNKGEKCKILYQWTYDELGRLIKSVDFSADKPFLTATYTYNKFNKIDSVYRQFTNNSKYLSQVYKFDDKGNKTEYYNCFEKTGCKITEKYEYNQAGLLQKKIEFRDIEKDTETNYKYDNAGNNIEMLITFKNSGTMKNTYFYDDKNNKVTSINYAPNGEKLDSTKYVYDQNGKLTHLKWMGGLNTNNVYTYDNFGNEIEYKSLALNGQLSDHRVMSYNDRLIMTRIHYKNKEINRYFKFEYERH